MGNVQVGNVVISGPLENTSTSSQATERWRWKGRRGASILEPSGVGRSVSGGRAESVGRSEVGGGPGWVWVSARRRHRRHSPPPPPRPAHTAPTDQPAAAPPTPPELDNRRAWPTAPPPPLRPRLIGTTADLLDLLSGRIIFNCRLDF